MAMVGGLLVPAARADAATPGGVVDLSFGSCGVRLAMPRGDGGFGTENSVANAVAVQPDGKIVLAGQPKFATSIVVVRLLADGGWDHSFGNAGSVVTYLPGGGPRISSVVLQPDGRIVVAGTQIPYGGGAPAVLLARYLPNGALDPSFGTGGMITHALDSYLYGLALQPDGKLVGAGQRVFRVLANGTLDPGFGSNGVAPTGHGVDVAIQTDGKIVVPYSTATGPPTGDDFTLLRLMPDGSPDPSFKSAPVDLGGGTDGVTDVALTGDGRIVTAGGSMVNGGADGVGLTRHLPGGALDATFGDQGRVVVPSLKPEVATPVRAAVQDDGKVVVAFTQANRPYGQDPILSFALARFTGGGDLDDSFGDHGLTVTPVNDRDGVVGGLARQPSGDWVVGGTLTHNWEEPMFPAAVRYHGGGTAASPRVTPANCRRDADVSSLAGWNFGMVGVGMRSTAHTFVLTNTGTAPVTPTGVGLREGGADQYRVIADACTGTTLAPGSTCAMSVVFAPTRSDVRTAQLVVWDDAGWGSQAAGLQGEGILGSGPMGWGSNDLGQRANSAGRVAGPVPLANVISVAAGYFHSVALKQDGTVWTWGWNGMGQLGDGTNVSRSTPVRVGGLTDVVAIAAGGYHGLAVRSDGTLWTWGWNYLGQLGDGSTVDRWRPVRVEGLPPVTAVAGGWVHSVAVGHDGSVRSWGWNGTGQLGDGSTVDRHRPVLVDGLGRIQSVATGIGHTLAVRTDGSLFAWGWNALGQLGDGTTADRTRPVPVQGVSDARLVTAGGYHSVVIRFGGNVSAWGWNGYGQLGDGTTVSRVTPAEVPGFQWARAVAGGFLHTLAVENDHTVRAWGWDSAGQVGDGGTDPRLSPVTVYGVGNARTVSAGAVHSLSA